jgi:SAM-dependent methyltransferase
VTTGKDAWQPTVFVPDGSGGWRPNWAHISRESRWIVTIQIESLFPLIRENAHGRLLDCGCGYAPYYGIYRDMVDEAIWIDWQNTAHVNPLLDAEVDLNRPLPFPDDSFDSVLLTDVLEHVAEPADLLREIARVLRPSGSLILSVPFYYLLHERPYDYYRYTEFGLRHLCRQAGLRVEELTPVGGQPDVVIDVISKWLVRDEISARLLMRVAGLVASWKRFRRWRESTSDRFPLVYNLVAVRTDGSTIHDPS